MNNPIFLDHDDIIKLWVITDNYEHKNPFKSSYKFFNYYKKDYPHNSSMCYPYDINPDQESHKKIIDEFATKFDNKIKVDELFIMLVDGMPTDLQSTKVNKFVSYLQNKYPDFFNQFTQALNSQNYLSLHESPFINAWIHLATKLNVNFKGQEIPSFIKEFRYNGDKHVTKLIGKLKIFDIDKAHDLVNAIVEYYPDNARIIESAQHFFEKNNISSEKKILPIFEDKEEKLYHYHMDFKPDAVLQRFKVSDTVAGKVLDFVAYYLAEHAYYGVRTNRTISDKDKPSLSISTPYEWSLKDAKKTYHEAIPIIFNDFLNTSNIEKIKENTFNEPLAKHLKEYIKVATLKNSLSDELQDKDKPAPKIKI